MHHRELYTRSTRPSCVPTGTPWLSIFDVDAGPVTITLPDAGQRFMSLQVIDGDQYTPEVHYGAGRYTFTREKIGTRYVSLGVRILVDPADPEDIKRLHALQDAIKVEQPGGPGRFEVPNWDQASQKKVRDALLVLGTTLPDTKRMWFQSGVVPDRPDPWGRTSSRSFTSSMSRTAPRATPACLRSRCRCRRKPTRLNLRQEPNRTGAADHPRWKTS